jgi:aspartate ammonia-lyase
MVEEDQDRLREAVGNLYEINLGATAIGTGVNAHPHYAATVCRHLGAVTGVPFVTSPDLIESTQDCGVFVLVSAMLKRYAVKLSKVCNDLRLLSSGPRAGLGELRLPECQAGSSIMPGKVNPVIPEVVNQVAFEVVGNDLTVTMAAEAGQLQLNAFEPIIAHSLLKSVRHLTAASDALAERCVAGIRVDAARMRRHVDSSIGLATALNPYLGYEVATDVARTALETGRGVVEVMLENGLMDRATLMAVLSPARLAGLVDGSPDEAAVTPTAH